MPVTDADGTEWVDDDPDCARARFQVRDELRQPVGLLHGGVMSTLVESVCSRATALAVVPDGMMAMGQSMYQKAGAEGAAGGEGGAQPGGEKPAEEEAIDVEFKEKK